MTSPSISSIFGYISSKTVSGMKIWLSPAGPKMLFPFFSRTPITVNRLPPMVSVLPRGSWCGKSVPASPGAMTVTFDRCSTSESLKKRPSSTK